MLESLKDNIASNKKLKQFFKNYLRKLNVNTGGEEVPGSTPLEALAYSKQLEIKLEAAKLIFGRLEKFNVKNLQIHPSPEQKRYRFKMEFVCSFNPFYEPNNRFGQRRAGKFNWVIDMQDCNLVEEEWFKKTRKVYENLIESGVENYDLVSHKGNLRYLVLKSANQQSMLTIVTKEDDENTKKSVRDAAELALKLGFKSVHWLQNNSLGDTAEGALKESFGEIVVLVQLFNKQFKVGYNNFFQNNIKGFEKILDSAKQSLKKMDKVPPILYDMYCGIGTIGICLEEFFEEIIGLEIVEENVQMAKENAKLNGINKAKFEIADLSKSNLQNLEKDSVMVVDPPRNGLEKKGLETILTAMPKVLIYISCNPITQAQDFIELEKKYKIEKLEVFDLYPQTYHMESLAILSRKN